MFSNQKRLWHNFSKKVNLFVFTKIKGRTVGLWKEVDINASIQSKIFFLVIPKVYQFTDKDRSITISYHQGWSFTSCRGGSHFQEESPGEGNKLSSHQNQKRTGPLSSILIPSSCQGEVTSSRSRHALVTELNESSTPGQPKWSLGNFFLGWSWLSRAVQKSPHH